MCLQKNGFPRSSLRCLPLSANFARMEENNRNIERTAGGDVRSPPGLRRRKKQSVAFSQDVLEKAEKDEQRRVAAWSLDGANEFWLTRVIILRALSFVYGRKFHMIRSKPTYPSHENFIYRCTFLQLPPSSVPGGRAVISLVKTD